MRGRKLAKEDCVRKIEKLKLKEAFEDNDFMEEVEKLPEPPESDEDTEKE